MQDKNDVHEMGNLLEEYIQKVARYTPQDWTFYMGLSFDDTSSRHQVIERLINGSFITDCITSWSVLPEVAKVKASWSSPDYYGLLIELMTSKRMGVIGKLGSNPNECECILRRYTKFRLISIDHTFNENAKNCKIIVEEIE